MRHSLCLHWIVGFLAFLAIPAFACGASPDAPSLSPSVLSAVSWAAAEPTMALFGRVHVGVGGHGFLLLSIGILIGILLARILANQQQQPPRPRPPSPPAVPPVRT